MPILSVLLAATTVAFTATGMPQANKAEDIYLGKLATCEDFWFAWKDDEPRMRQYIDRFDAGYTRSEDEPA